jgi:hypothetical protein
MVTTARRWDVEAFERLLWQWFDAQSEINYGGDQEKADELRAAKAFAAVLAAFREEEVNTASQPLPPQNSRDSDFP